MPKLIEWTATEKPNVNQWYRVKQPELDYIKITKDFYSPEKRTTYYKLLEYYQGETIYQGRTLAEARDLVRMLTWRKAE